MNADGLRILDCLQSVASERRRRREDEALGRRVIAVKAFQHARFALTYADLLSSKSYASAARFFLDELYGPHDFTARDEQFARVVPALVRLFPSEIVGTVRTLADLHCISEALDTRMGATLSDDMLQPSDYAAAWRTVGEPALRERQIVLTVEIGSALERYTRRALLRHTLRAMRGPAQMAGLAALQRFLESGFDTFREMPDPGKFLQIIAERERVVARALFGGDDSVVAGVDAATAAGRR